MTAYRLNRIFVEPIHSFHTNPLGLVPEKHTHPFHQNHPTPKLPCSSPSKGRRESESAVAAQKCRHFRIGLKIRFPSFKCLIQKDYDWTHSVYGNDPEEVQDDMHEPKGKFICTTSFVDANLYHRLVTGRDCTGIMHFGNQTPIELFSKHQSSVETATYGSAFVAA